MLHKNVSRFSVIINFFYEIIYTIHDFIFQVMNITNHLYANVILISIINISIIKRLYNRIKSILYFICSKIYNLNMTQ